MRCGHPSTPWPLRSEAGLTKAGPLGLLREGANASSRGSRVPAHDSVNDAAASPNEAGFWAHSSPSARSSDHILFALGLLSLQSALLPPSPPESPMESQGQECAAVRAQERGRGKATQGTYISRESQGPTPPRPEPRGAAQPSRGAGPQHGEYPRTIPCRNPAQALPGPKSCLDTFWRGDTRGGPIPPRPNGGASQSRREVAPARLAA